ncbi:hypothetical protein UP06_18860 [Bradyrhizobium sp. LTSP857]|nr:hypothetical protein UP06_18860 [Bradyrhizobium sp. LTSP857]
MLKDSKDCSERNWKAKSNDFVSFAPSCGGVKITAFRECQTVSDASWCAYNGVGQKYRACMQQALAAERKPFDDDVAKDKERRAKIATELLRQQCSANTVLPKPEACNALKSSGSGFEEVIQKDTAK